MADFIDQVKSHAARAAKLRDSIPTEEATKQALVLPFLQILGYDVFNPEELLPEFTADVGVKKGERVDYAVVVDGNPMVLIECKWCGGPLEKHDSQLFRYFGTTTAKYAILTNGIVYKFYTDLELENKMDLTPFLEIDLLDLRETLVPEIKKFHKEVFDPESLHSTASDLKYSKALKDYFSLQLAEPSDDFASFFTGQVYEGKKTAVVIERFKSLVKDSLGDFITERMNARLREALGTDAPVFKGEAVQLPPPPQAEEPVAAVSEIPELSIATTATEEELQYFYAVKSMLHGVFPLERVTYKNTETYFGVLADGMVTKWICRIKTGKRGATIIFPKLVEEPFDKETKHDFTGVDELYKFSDPIVLSAKRFAE